MNSKKFVIRMTKSVRTVLIVLTLLSPLVYAKLSGSLSVEAITKRLQPMAKVNVEGADAAAARELEAGAGVALGPKQIYEENCKMCHQTGLSGAPRLGNKAEWAPRISQGLDTMVQHAWAGIRAMPPKGNCLQCTQEQIKETVQFMVDTVK